jgi:hypothetical protein
MQWYARATLWLVKFFNNSIRAEGYGHHLARLERNRKAVAKHSTFEAYGIAQLATRPDTGIDIENDHFHGHKNQVLRTAALAVSEGCAQLSTSAAALTPPDRLLLCSRKLSAVLLEMFCPEWQEISCCILIRTTFHHRNSLETACATLCN